jgi:hypothetical protein
VFGIISLVTFSRPLLLTGPVLSGRAARRDASAALPEAERIKAAQCHLTK